jgi:hypothetical protein
MRWLSQLKEWATRRPVARVDDDVLGPLNYKEGCWEAERTLAGRPIGFAIGGRYEPDPAAIARARDIAGSFEQFEKEIAAYLASVAAREEYSVAADEVRSLVIRQVALFHRGGPADGVVFFDGGDEFRSWRCDLNGRQPTELGFGD